MLFTNSEITLDNQVVCKIHKQNVEYLECFVQHPHRFCQFLCNKCFQTNSQQNDLQIKSKFQGFLDLQACSISLLNIPKGSKADHLDFMSSKLEYVIYDFQSLGYPTQGLFYIPEKQLLAVCGQAGSTGRVILWKIGDDIRMHGDFDIEGKKIYCGKYIDGFLMIGTDDGVHVYDELNLTKEKRIVNAGFKIIDIQLVDYDEQKFLLTVQEKDIKVWDLKEMKLQRVIDFAQNDGINSSIHSVIYVKEHKKLAIEYDQGLCLIDFSEKSESAALLYYSANKKAFGLGYLPKSEQFLLRINSREIDLIDFNNLAFKFRFALDQDCDETEKIKFLSNKDETQVLCSSQNANFMVLGNQSCHCVNVNNLIKNSSCLEILEDQSRFVVGDRDSGILLVFRSFESSLYWVPGLMNSDENAKLLPLIPNLVFESKIEVLCSPEKSSEFYFCANEGGEMIEVQNEKKFISKEEIEEEENISDDEEERLVQMKRLKGKIEEDIWISIKIHDNEKQIN